MDDKIYDEPSGITVEDGAVHVKGPDGVDVKLTPEAAHETSDRLFDWAKEVRKRRDDQSDKS